MIVEYVGGKARQVFLAGEASEDPSVKTQFRCYAPIKLGAGYRKRIELAKTKGAVSDGTMAEVIAIYAKAQKMPKGLDKKAWDQQLKDQALEAITANIDIATTGNVDQYILEALLTPEAGAPSVEELYLEYMSEEQVEAVINFSEGRAESKTETEQSVPTSGKGLKAAPKVARSTATSPQPSEI